MNVVLFLVGVFVGMALHRLIMAMVLEKSPDTLCAYCEWLGRKRRRIERGSIHTPARGVRHNQGGLTNE